jgi:hypothetical protein
VVLFSPNNYFPAANTAASRFGTLVLCGIYACVRLTLQGLEVPLLRGVLAGSYFLLFFAFAGKF